MSSNQPEIITIDDDNDDDDDQLQSVSVGNNPNVAYRDRRRYATRQNNTVSGGSDYSHNNNGNEGGYTNINSIGDNIGDLSDIADITDFSGLGNIGSYSSNINGNVGINRSTVASVRLPGLGSFCHCGNRDCPNQDEIARLENDLINRDNSIHDLANGLQQSKQIIETLQQAILDKDNLIEGLKQANSAMFKNSTTKDTTIKKYESEINSIKQQLFQFQSKFMKNQQFIDKQLKIHQNSHLVQENKIQQLETANKQLKLQLHHAQQRQQQGYSNDRASRATGTTADHRASNNVRLSKKSGANTVMKYFFIVSSNCLFFAF